MQYFPKRLWQRNEAPKLKRPLNYCQQERATLVSQKSKEALAKKRGTETEEAIELLSAGKSYIGAANERLDNVLVNVSGRSGDTVIKVDIPDIVSVSACGHLTLPHDAGLCVDKIHGPVYQHRRT